jgi:pimeloyl-ACP methyl ester carboxylesterase
MRRLLVVALLLGTVAAATVMPPVLTISLENVITQPQRNGKGRLIRPLVLYVADWSTPMPQVEAYTYTGVVTATLTRLTSAAGHWDATVKYTVTAEPGGPAYSGEVALHLTLHGVTVLGTYEGAFNGIAAKGAADAGLTWTYADATRRGLLLWLSDPSRKVRALLLWGNGPGLSAKHIALRQDLQAFAAANDVAVIGMDGFGLNMPQRDGDAIHQGLRSLAAASGHAELATAPILFSGHSMGGQIAYEYNAWNPERVIAFTVSKAGAHRELSPEAGATPAVLVAGEKDLEGRVRSILQMFDISRPHGAPWSLEVEENAAHEFGRSLPLFLLHFQHALDRRLVGGKLLPLDMGRGWLADNSTWKEGITRIFPVARFKGDAAHLSWLLDEDVAYVYRGVATYGNPLTVELSDKHGIQYFAGEPLILDCKGLDGDWNSVAVYDGARRIAEVRGARVTLPRQKVGTHAGVLVGERKDGSVRTSWPVAWVVRPAL